MRLNELKNLKSDIRKKADALKQRNSHVEEEKVLVKLNIKELKRKIKNTPEEEQLDFTDYLERQQEENEIDLGLFFEIAEENKIIYNQTAVNTLVEDMEKGRF